MKEKYAKYLASIVVLVVVTAGLFLNILKRTSDTFTGFRYPQSGLTKVQTAPRTGMAKDYLTIRMQCPDLPVTVALPKGSMETNGMLNGTYDNISFIIAACEDDPEDMLKNRLPCMVNQPVLGFAPKYTEVTTDYGYLKENSCRYYSGYVETKISVRTVTEYVVSYYMEFGMNEDCLIFYASTKETERMDEARDLLIDMMESVKPVAEEESEKADVETVREKDGKEELFDFSVEVRNDFILYDAVCVMSWTNITVEPAEICLMDQEEVIATPDPEYSYPGEYVFFFGRGEIKSYQLKGKVSQPVVNVEVHFMNRKDFEAYLDWQSDTSDAVPHTPD